MNRCFFKKFAFLAFITFSSVAAFAQQTEINTNNLTAYNSGLELYNSKAYAAAQKIFKEVAYKQEIGPGIYDIHSPRVPSVEEMVEQIKALIEVLPKEQLWINPDCGLKTRKWPEVKESLKNMVEAVRRFK